MSGILSEQKSEQKYEGLRLVINYQTLNHFLQDDKFPLPNIKAFFANLYNAKYLSKFDLKVKFKQLDVHPNDR